MNQYLSDLGLILSQFFSEFHRVWNFTVVQMDGGQLTLGKLIIAIVLVIIGYHITARLSLKLSQFIFKHASIDISVQATIEKVTFYIIYFIVILFVLRLIDVPITIFTVLGGAAAIGVGFGSQHIIKTFISGIVLLFERPIRVGDLVELDGLFGMIEGIGFRSTKIKTEDNIHIVVPNNIFLENKIVNWTLSGALIRHSLKVGVAYGSDTQKVQSALYEASHSHPKVKKKPSPFVIFADFGSSSLDFELLFWTEIRSKFELVRVLSELRFEVETLFRERNITISFPQRDVHLDSLSPIQIQMVSPNPVSSNPSPSQ